MLFRGGGFRHGVKDVLDVQPVLERRGRRVPALDRQQEIADLVGEGVLPADDVALRPPRGQVGVFRFVDQDPAETLLPGRGCGIEEFEFVQVLKVKAERALVSIDFHRQGVLPAGGNPGDLHRRDGAGGEGEGGPRGVVDSDGFQSVRAGPLVHERVEAARNPGDRIAQQEQHLVDGVRGDVPQCP